MVFLHFKQGINKYFFKYLRKFILIDLKTRLNNDKVRFQSALNSNAAPNKIIERVSYVLYPVEIK